jgi:hypothetical protein
MAADEQLRTVRETPMTDTEIKIHVVANAIGWEMFKDRIEGIAGAEEVVLSDEEIAKCKRAAIRAISHLQEIGVHV